VDASHRGIDSRSRTRGRIGTETIDKHHATRDYDAASVNDACHLHYI
jgi:hypothetical protein